MIIISIQNTLHNIRYPKPMSSQQWLKLAECKYSPTQIFTMFDYTKIVYPIDSGFYLKQVVTQEQKTTFIEIKHEFDQILAIHGALNNVVSVECKGEHFFVCFYGVAVEEVRVRLQLQLDGKLEVASLYGEDLLMLCFTAEDGVTHQIIFMDCLQKVVVARGLVEGSILDMCIGPNCSLSLFMPKHVVCYKNEPLLDQQITRIYKQTQANITVETDHHFWIEDELFVWGKNKGYIIIKNKICQEFNEFHRLHNAIPLTCGFLACDGCVLKVFKKKNIRYELICEIVDEHLMECKNLSLSPQQDILAYFTPVSEALIVAATFAEQVEEAQMNQNPMQMAITLKAKEISHVKSYDYTVYSSMQSWFAAVNGTQIKLISSGNYQQFLTIELSDPSQKNYMSTSQLKARHVSIHPNRPILAVALKTKIKLYYITFNEIKVLKQINVSMCGYLVFNHSGSLLTAVVSGKGGAKLYIYKVNQFKSDFSLLETITIGKRPINVEWDQLDTMLYCFFAEGYYQWTLESKLKDRKECLFNFKFPVAGATLSKEDYPIFWGNQSLVPIVEDTLGEYQTVKQKIKQIFIEGEYYIIVFETGKIGRNKSLDLESCFSKSFDLSTKGKNFQIRLQECNKLIYLSSQLNLKFFEFASSTATNSFTNVMSIDKKKLYTIMNKHQEYEQQIKKIREEYALVIQEYRAKSVAEQLRIQNEYKYELKDHVERERKVKEEKAKLEELMENNIEIKERESINQIKELERLYERKIALTTNKLLTEKEIGFRDKITAEAKLKLLEDKHYSDIEQIRKQFSEHLKSNILDRNETQKQINLIKKQYETRLYELEEQNEILLKDIQQKNETSLTSLKKMINNWENKYSECMSQKDNTEKEYQNQLLNCQRLKEKIAFLEIRKQESERRCENLSNQVLKVQRVLEERNKTIQFYEKRIQDLEKSNQILKYRVLEVKQQNDPYEAQITKLKQNMTDLEEQYEKMLKSSYEQEQKMQIIKKQKSKLKQDLQVISQKYMKLSKRHEQLLDKVRETTKSPIQEIRKQLLAIVDSYARINKSYSTIQRRADSPLGELNRIRDHLEVCLDEAMTTNKKNEEQRKIQITKKNRENSELIIEINTMRKKIRQLEGQIKDKNLQISRLIRGQTPTIVSKQQKIEPTEAQSKQFTKTKSRQRETFYEKSMFRSGTHWNQKRLKTEQNGGRRKKSSLSMMRDRNHNSLAIHPQAEEIEEYKRIIEQKDIFIQKLIAKIQKT